MLSDEKSIDCVDDSIDDVQARELQNSMSAYLSEYPCASKLLAVFPLDGNILDTDANMFEFVDDNTAIRRWAKVPKERESAMALIGVGSKPCYTFGFIDIDLVVLDAEIKKRLKENEHKRDGNGDIWEVREKVILPFKCHAKLFNKTGKELDKFRIRSNGLGFAWTYFWLRKWTPPSKAKRSKRIGGKMVTVMSNDESSQYTEKTVSSCPHDTLM